MARKVLLFTTVDWLSTARYAQGFAAASWTVDALSPKGAPVTFSRYVDAQHRYRALLPLGSLRKTMERARPDLIVACDDRAVALLLRLLGKVAADGEIAGLIRRSLGCPENFPAMISRSESMRIAGEIGIRAPQTVPVGDAAQLDACLERLGLPAVLKADGSWGGDGVIVARTRDEAHAAFARLMRPASRLRNLARAARRKDAHFLIEALRPAKQRVSVQKFVAGRSAASAFACWKGEMVAHLHYDVLVADGAIGPPNVVRRVDCEEMEEASRLVAKRFGLSGIYGLDFIRDAQGNAHLIEINPRTTQGGTLAFGDGRDMPQALAACVTRMPAKRRDAFPSDVVAFFPAEWQRDAASPWLSSGHHNVPWDDPAVLKHCFDRLPQAQTPDRKAAIERLLASAPAGEERAQSIGCLPI
ncbi:MAG: ATP-grasp domain-containing protein [Alphaproteobacteria bacterium]|nr:ATP-grasp domain-containing protein [Alphaproteobacteria bacterium]